MSASLTDPEIERLRDGMYGLARVALPSIDLYKRETSNENEALRKVPVDLRHEVEERIAIMQFDGGLSRKDALRSALIAYRMKGGVQ